MMNYDPDYDLYDMHDEYGDPDVISCAMGDYNTWEENQIFYDNEDY